MFRAGDKVISPSGKVYTFTAYAKDFSFCMVTDADDLPDHFRPDELWMVPTRRTSARMGSLEKAVEKSILEKVKEIPVQLNGHAFDDLKQGERYARELRYVITDPVTADAFLQEQEVAWIQLTGEAYHRHDSYFCTNCREIVHVWDTNGIVVRPAESCTRSLEPQYFINVPSGVLVCFFVDSEAYEPQIMKGYSTRKDTRKVDDFFREVRFPVTSVQQGSVNQDEVVFVEDSQRSQEKRILHVMDESLFDQKQIEVSEDEYCATEEARIHVRPGKYAFYAKPLGTLTPSIACWVLKRVGEAEKEPPYRVRTIETVWEYIASLLDSHRMYYRFPRTDDLLHWSQLTEQEKQLVFADAFPRALCNSNSALWKSSKKLGMSVHWQRTDAPVPEGPFNFRQSVLHWGTELTIEALSWILDDPKELKRHGQILGQYLEAVISFGLGGTLQGPKVALVERTNMYVAHRLYKQLALVAPQFVSEDYIAWMEEPERVLAWVEQTIAQRKTQ